jgi:hypothetical protein
MANHDALDSTSLEPCETYIEEKKKISSRDHITQRTFSIDYISDLTSQHNITSFENFQRQIPTATKIQLLKQLGYVGQNIIKTLIKIYTTDRLQTIKSKHYFHLLIEKFQITLHNPQNVTWLTNFFLTNNMQIITSIFIT